MAKGDAGRLSLSERLHRSLRRGLNQTHTDLILILRDARKPDPKRIQAELLRHHALRLPTATR